MNRTIYKIFEFLILILTLVIVCLIADTHNAKVYDIAIVCILFFLFFLKIFGFFHPDFKRNEVVGLLTFCMYFLIVSLSILYYYYIYR